MKQIIFKINLDSELSIKVQKILFDYDYKWYGGGSQSTIPKYYDKMESIVLDVEQKLLTYFPYIPSGYDDEVDYFIKEDGYDKEDLLLLNRLTDLISYLKNGKIAPDYNKPKELVYEANDNYEKYNRIAIKIESENDFKIVCDIIKKSTGYNTEDISWYGRITCPFVFYIGFKNLSNNEYGWDKYENVKRMLDTNTFYPYCYDYLFNLKSFTDIRTIEETIKNKKLSLKNIPDYNKPKELVYEAMDIDKYYKIIVKLNNKETLEYLIDFLNHNKDRIHINIDGLLKFRRIFFRDKFPFAIYINFKFDDDDDFGWDFLNDIEEMIEENNLYNSCYERIFDPDNIDDFEIIKKTILNKKLTIVSAPDYNKPKELVYEANNPNEYHTIAIKIESNDDIEKIASIVKNNSNIIDCDDILEYKDSSIIFPYVIYIKFNGYKRIQWDRLITVENKIKNNTFYEGHYEKIFDLDNDSDIEIITNTLQNKKLTLNIKPNYNKQKKLVYEKNKSIYTNIKDFLKN